MTTEESDKEEIIRALRAFAMAQLRREEWGMDGYNPIRLTAFLDIDKLMAIYKDDQ